MRYSAVGDAVYYGVGDYFSAFSRFVIDVFRIVFRHGHAQNKRVQPACGIIGIAGVIINIVGDGLDRIHGYCIVYTLFLLAVARVGNAYKFSVYVKTASAGIAAVH